MAYSAKDYSSLMGIDGFGETVLKNHSTLYQGYVTNTNKLAAMLEYGKAGIPEYSGLKHVDCIKIFRNIN